MSLVYADLHLGNSYSDILSFLELLSKVKESRKFIQEIILLGDILDGIEKYETQKEKQYPESLTLQRKMLRWLIELLHNEFEESSIIYVVGNHEKDFKGIIFDENIITKEYPFVKITKEYIDMNRILYLHSLGSTRFGGLSGWTPSSIMKALTILATKQNKIWGGLQGICIGHVHKVLDIVSIGGVKFILLPSFLKEAKETGDQFYRTPAIIYIFSFEDETKISVFEKPFNSTETIISFNDILVSVIRQNYRKITRLEKVLKLKQFI